MVAKNNHYRCCEYVITQKVGWDRREVNYSCNIQCPYFKKENGLCPSNGLVSMADDSQFFERAGVEYLLGVALGNRKQIELF